MLTACLFVMYYLGLDWFVCRLLLCDCVGLVLVLGIFVFGLRCAVVRFDLVGFWIVVDLFVLFVWG